MPKRTYDQYCPLACALDLIGERWTLLIVRDLIAGPKRYTDLRRGLPGLATDLLTERLRALEDAGVLRRRKLPPPAAATVYELTERGRELEPAVFGLARFGLSQLGGPPTAEDPPTPDRFGLLLRALFDADRASREPETWVFGGGAPVAVTVSREGVELHANPDEAPRPPTARFIGDVPTIYELVVGRLDTSAALADGRLRVEGDAGALERMRTAFPTPARDEALAGVD
jgi:DNA-binding HxlR family transcriptional regulator